MDWISPRVCRPTGIPGSVVLLLLLGAPLVAAAEPPEPSKRVARLIKDLGARDFPTRSSAHRHLSIVSEIDR